jgi:hypothetical protein
MALLADAMATSGVWAALVGLPGFGALAAAVDYGVDLGRLEGGGFADSCHSAACNSLQPLRKWRYPRVGLAGSDA